LTFGIINFVEYSGSGYITNLVDTLNSGGFPYFSFGYSNKLHPEKGLRYFTIKNPACWSWQIEITDSSDALVYFYSDLEQQTSWFGAPADFGYGTAFIGIPEGCIETTEY